MIKSFAEKRVIDVYEDADSNIYACEDAIQELAKAILEIKETLNKEKKNMKGKVRFFCACGKEMWEELNEWDRKHLTIQEAEETCICADCLIK